MKKLITLSLTITSLLILSAQAFAGSCGPGCATNEEPFPQPKILNLGPQELNDLSEAACKDSGMLISDDPQACSSALNTCKAHFKGCVQSQCHSYQDYYGDTYHNCSETVLDQCNDERQPEKIGSVASACAFSIDGKQGKSEWPQTEPENVTMQYFPGLVFKTEDKDPPENKEPEEEVENQEPSQPDLDSAGDTHSNTDTGFAFEPVAEPSVEFSGSGGCSLQSLGSQASGLQNLLLLFIGFIPGIWASRRIKKNR